LERNIVTTASRVTEKLAYLSDSVLIWMHDPETMVLRCSISNMMLRLVTKILTKKTGRVLQSTKWLIVLDGSVYDL
jgi:hypothetical protein